MYCYIKNLFWLATNLEVIHPVKYTEHKTYIENPYRKTDSDSNINGILSNTCFEGMPLSENMHISCTYLYTHTHIKRKKGTKYFVVNVPIYFGRQVYISPH